eukprot:CAMPEP_0182889708 /NCGR_PEP_ID=MMETSP0034_2-20130328/22204_1 /TAXON_ID=156128 /ORGANISM="Nephroselmis pyriformis, Strain CCMP717" /LENGTH=36 /DNA_ID= /DNA_START= /DNA_END= /DNA_ORIENTATION=
MSSCGGLGSGDGAEGSGGQRPSEEAGARLERLLGAD